MARCSLCTQFSQAERTSALKAMELEHQEIVDKLSQQSLVNRKIDPDTTRSLSDLDMTIKELSDARSVLGVETRSTYSPNNFFEGLL